MPKQTTETPQTPPTAPEPETQSPKMGKFLTGVAVVLLLGTTGAAGYFYQQLDEIKKNPNKAAQDETAATIAAVGKLMVLPSEQPTLATVTDPEKLKEQPFFASAKIGDKLLIYTTAKKAILYNPTENKIVEVAPVSLGNQTQVSGTSTDTNNDN